MRGEQPRAGGHGRARPVQRLFRLAFAGQPARLEQQGDRGVRLPREQLIEHLVRLLVAAAGVFDGREPRFGSRQPS